MLYIFLYFVISIALLLFFIEDAAEKEGLYEDYTLWDNNEWYIAVGVAVLWLPAIVILLLYGIFYSWFQWRVKSYTEKRETDESFRKY